MSEHLSCSITPGMLSCVEQIREETGRAESTDILRDRELRRINRIHAIHGSLATDGNRQGGRI